MLTSALNIELFKRRNNRQTTDKLGNQTVANQIFRFDVGENFTDIAALVLALHFRAKTDTAFLGAIANNLIQARQMRRRR